MAAYLCWTRLVQRQVGSKPGAGADVGHWKIQGRCMVLMAQAPATSKILPSYPTPLRGLVALNIQLDGGPPDPPPPISESVPYSESEDR